MRSIALRVPPSKGQVEISPVGGNSVSIDLGLESGIWRVILRQVDDGLEVVIRPP